MRSKKQPLQEERWAPGLLEEHTNSDEAGDGGRKEARPVRVSVPLPFSGLDVHRDGGGIGRTCLRPALSMALLLSFGDLSADELLSR